MINRIIILTIGIVYVLNSYSQILDDFSDGDFSYNPASKSLSYTITVANPDGISLTAMHIHLAEEGDTGPEVQDLGLSATTTGFVETGSVTLSAADASPR